MYVTIRNKRLLRLLGFEPMPRREPFVSMSVTSWLRVIGWRIRGVE